MLQISDKKGDSMKNTIISVTIIFFLFFIYACDTGGGGDGNTSIQWTLTGTVYIDYFDDDDLQELDADVKLACFFMPEALGRPDASCSIVSNVINIGQAFDVPSQFTMDISMQGISPEVDDSCVLFMWEDTDGDNAYDIDIEDISDLLPTGECQVFSSIAGASFFYYDDPANGWYLYNRQGEVESVATAHLDGASLKNWTPM
jgi:hypothetical protein